MKNKNLKGASAEHIDRADKIIAAICAEFNLEPEDIFGDRFFRRVSEPRCLAIALVAANLPWDHSIVGDYFNRSRSAISYSVKHAGEWERFTSNFEPMIDRICDKMNLINSIQKKKKLCF